MTTKTVEMAKRDPANAQRFVAEETEVAIVTVSIRNRDKRPAGRMLNDVISGQVKFRPGQVKTLEVSAAFAAELKARRDPSWELVRTSSTLHDDEEGDQ